jgi:uncharacterized protein HemX
VDDRTDVSSPLVEPGEKTALVPSQEAPVQVRRSLRRLALPVALLVLIALIAGLGYLAWSNYDRAQRWQTRAATLERNATALNDLLVRRSAALNARTRELNAMAAKVRSATVSLRRSEQDVASLAKRQRELSNEKAQVEDERAQLAAESSALSSVASSFIDCKDGLVGVIEYIAADDYDSASYYWPDVSGDCQLAEDELANYNASYGRD